MGQLKYAGTTRMSGGRPKWNGVVRIDEESLWLPKTWKAGRVIFVNSMSDLFHEYVPLAFIKRVFATMQETPQHTYQILTKRAERLEVVAGEGGGCGDGAGDLADDVAGTAVHRIAQSVPMSEHVGLADVAPRRFFENGEAIFKATEVSRDQEIGTYDENTASM
jgi:hypothetical protein